MHDSLLVIAALLSLSENGRARSIWAYIPSKTDNLISVEPKGFPTPDVMRETYE